MRQSLPKPVLRCLIGMQRLETKQSKIYFCFTVGTCRCLAKADVPCESLRAELV